MSAQRMPAGESASAENKTPIYDSARHRWAFIAELVEIWLYRDLLKQLIIRNIKIRYKRSVLGIVWTMLNPLMMMMVLTFVFSETFRFNTRHYPAYALAGLTLWNFFSQTTNGAMSELVWGGNLMHRIYIPRAIFAFTALGTSLVNVVLAMVPLLLIMLVTGVPIRSTILILPVSLVLMALFALGVALFLSRLAAYFADVMEMYQIFLTAWMYFTPIIYPKEIVPERYRWFFNLNPIYHLIETFRAPLYIGWFAGPKTVTAAAVAGVAAFLLGWWFFTRKVDELAYRI